MSDDVVLRVRGLTREFARRRPGLLGRRPDPVRALVGVDLDVRRGERFGIVGESGSGKTTLARLLMGLDRPTSGTIEFDGQSVHDKSQAQLRFLRQRMQMVFQDPMSSLDPRMRVRDIVLEPLDGLGMREDRDARLTELLDAVGLPAGSAHRYPHQFSGGQRQRIAIARALAPRPDVLVADEPVSALDVSVRAQTLNLLTDLTARLGLTLVFVSHDLSVVRYLTDRMVVMRRGEVVEEGWTREVYAAPQHPYTQELLASVPVLRHGRRVSR
jgi:ABC-type glutathione transport system ATPase component